ncbi:MAG TPA: glutamine synthetase family protein [Thermomicrobiales bacterium]|nr:glutamine synthetase family protein [Thermomicrobiales bacterium]
MLAVDDLERAGYQTVVIATPDTQGRPVGRQLPLRRFLDDPLAGVEVSSYILVYDLAGIPLQDSPYSGAQTGYHDVRLLPDLSTLRPYPGVPATAICLADLVDEGGTEVPFAPRAVLKGQVEAAGQMGFEVRLATELEFYLFENDLREARRLGYRGLEPTTPARSTYGTVAAIAQQPFLTTICQAMEAAGIMVGSAQTEAGRGQWEVNFQHTDPLQAADHHLVYKACVRELARQAGLTVTFMARPVVDDLGSSCHLHFSLTADNQPVFPIEPGSGALSRTAQHAVGGLLEHLPATAFFFAPFANSYKRQAPGFAAGGVTAWGQDNRSVAIRVVGRGESLRVEHRFPGADANPYLAAAALIAAGLDGIASRRDPGSPVAGDADARPELPRPPASLGEALASFESSQFVRKSFGDAVAAHYAAHARAEWAATLVTVTDWELTRGFEAV